MEIKSCDNFFYFPQKISFKKISHDQFLDFIKGICIIFVILNHCMPEDIMQKTGFFFWGDSAVPVFLIIQVFHAYKNNKKYPRTNYKKLWTRILRPFFLIEFVTIPFSYIKTCSNIGAPVSLQEFLIDILKWGGNGPGSYYPWIYIQFAIIIPFLYPVFKSYKTNLSFLCLFFILISQSLEFACIYGGISDRIYRLIFIRYIYLFFLGFVLAHKGFVINISNITIGLVCLIATSCIVYTNFDFGSFLISYPNSVCHWFCYIYIAFLLFPLLKILYYLIKEITFIKNIIIKFGIHSYDIFLFQMVYFALIDDYIISFLNNLIYNEIIFLFFKLVLPITICMISVMIYKRLTIYIQHCRNRNINEIC